MRNKHGWLVVTAMALLPACGSGTKEVVKNDVTSDASVAKDTLTANVSPDLAETQASRDSAPDLAPADAPAVDVAPDLAAVEAGLPDRATPTDAGGIDLLAIVDLAKSPEVQGDAGKPDTALPDAAPDLAGEAGMPPNYTCRDDSDCCIVVDSCMVKAYLYSKAPGASPAPAIPAVSNPGSCLRCVAPAVQVRCDNGYCVGQKLSGYSGTLTQSHCGPVIQPDAGSSPDEYYPAYAGAEPTSWGC
jgi:hypothetical protein